MRDWNKNVISDVKTLVAVCAEIRMTALSKVSIMSVLLWILNNAYLIFRTLTCCFVHSVKGICHKINCEYKKYKYSSPIFYQLHQEILLGISHTLTCYRNWPYDHHTYYLAWLIQRCVLVQLDVQGWETTACSLQSDKKKIINEFCVLLQRVSLLHVSVWRTCVVSYSIFMLVDKGSAIWHANCGNINLWKGCVNYVIPVTHTGWLRRRLPNFVDA